MEATGGASRIAVVVAVLLLAAMVPVGTASEAQVDARAEVRSDVRGSILIQGDADFTSENGVRGGTGTPEDPFVISNWTILSDHGFGAWFENTRAHVVIEDLFISGEDQDVFRETDCTLRFLNSEDCFKKRGIGIFNAENITIRNVIIHSSTIGIDVRDAANIHVATTDLGIEFTQEPPMGTMGEGIVALRVSNLTVENTTIPNTLHPLFLGDIEGGLVRQNTFVGGPTTLPAGDVSNVNFVRNDLRDITVLLSGESPDASFIGNHFIGGPQAIQTDGSGDRSNLHICGNVVRDIQTTGSTEAVEIFQADDARIEGNSFINNSHALEFEVAKSATFTMNLVTGTGADPDNRSFEFFSPGGNVEANAFEGNAGQIVIGGSTSTLGPADATENWWGSPDGPSGDGSGSGDAIRVFSGVEFDPWLASRPMVGPGSVDCGVALGPVGALERPAPTVDASLFAGFDAVINEKVGPVHAKTNVKATASYEESIPVPEYNAPV